MSAVSTAQAEYRAATTYDQGRRRLAKRARRERGCWVYIPAVELLAAGLAPDDPPPWYRMWPRPGRRSVVVSLYREP